MDAKDKIAEMLKRKREGDGAQEVAAPPVVAPVARVQVDAPVNAGADADLHGSARARIAAMLQKKQTAPAQPDNNNGNGVAHPVAHQVANAVPPAPPVIEPVSAAVRFVPVQNLPFGLCRCCAPAAALMALPDRRILSPVSNEEYVQNVDGSVVLKPRVQLPDDNNIEAALNDGHAAFYYGGFIGERAESETPRRRRRR